MFVLTNLVRVKISVILILLIFMAGPAFAQVSLSKSGVAQIADAVVLNPANVLTQVKAPGLKLRGPAKYRVKVGFDFDNIPDEQRKLLFLRVQLYTPSGNLLGPSNPGEAWTLLNRFSSSGGLLDKIFTVFKDTQWLITSWYPDNNRRGGIGDCGLDYTVDELTEGNTKGLVFKFKTPYGTIVVNILPVL